MQRAKIDIQKVLPNEGQIEGLPRNPRLIKDEKFRKLCRSIQSLPEMTEARDILVYPYQDNYVVIGDNMRLQAYKAHRKRILNTYWWSAQDFFFYGHQKPLCSLPEFSQKHLSSFRLYDKSLITLELQAERCSQHPSAMLHFVLRRTINRSTENDLSFGWELFTAFRNERKLKDGLLILHSVIHYMKAIYHTSWKMKGVFGKTLVRREWRWRIPPYGFCHSSVFSLSYQPAWLP